MLKLFKCNPNEALLIGDKISDCKAGTSAGVLSILIDRNHEYSLNEKESQLIICNSLEMKNLKKYIY